MARTSKVWGRHQIQHTPKALREPSDNENFDSKRIDNSDEITLLTVMPSTVTAGNLPAPLPPSVEEAYRKKCIELKRRMTEVEESNDAYRLRKVRLTRAIRKMRLERAYLLETLGKRMKNNGGGGNELQGYYDEESEGSSEGPPTPHEKPLRSKRSQRRAVPSPPPVLDNNISHANPQYQAPAFHAYEPRREADSNHHSTHSPTDGQPAIQPYHSIEGPTPFLHPRPMVPLVAPPTAFQLYAETRFVSQPHHNSSKHANSPDALMQLAHETWDTESEGVKQSFLLQESKAQESHAAKLAAAQDYEVQHQQQQQQQRQAARNATSEDRATSFHPRGGGRADTKGDAEAEAEAVAERMDVDDAEKTVVDAGRTSAAAASGAGGGFTSING